MMIPETEMGAPGIIKNTKRRAVGATAIGATVEVAAAVLAPADPDRAIEVVIRKIGRNTIIAPKIKRSGITNGIRKVKSTKRNRIGVNDPSPKIAIMTNMVMILHPILPPLYQIMSVISSKRIPNKVRAMPPLGALVAAPPSLENTA